MAEDLTASLEGSSRVSARMLRAERAASAADARAEQAPTSANQEAADAAGRENDAAYRAYRLQNHEFDSFAVERALRQRHGERLP